jgi:membrane protease YdiL (CAAX protease family)
MKRLAVYLAVTFGLTWGLLIPAGIALGTFEHGESSSLVMVVLITASMFFPLVGALAANAASGSEGRIDLGLKLRLEGNLRLYLAAWFAPAVFTLLGCVVFFVLNPSLFDPSMESFLAADAAAAGASSDQLAAQMPPAPVLLTSSLFAALTIAPFINAIPAAGEEIGWRGLLLPTLCERLSERGAVLVSGVIWGLWHAPVIAMGHNYGMDYAGFPLVGILVMIVACTAIGCALGYLRLKTGSMWPCALAHGAINAIASTGVAFCTVGPGPMGPSLLGLVSGIPAIILGIVCLLQLSPAKPQP